MNKKTRNNILAVSLLLIALTITAAAIPAIARQVPGRYRVALAERSPAVSAVAEGLYDRVLPIPTALPQADEMVMGETAVDVSALLATDIPPTLAPPTTMPTTAPEEDENESASAPITVTPPPTAVLIETPIPAPLPVQMSIDGLTAVRQTFNNCGPANLVQVLDWYGANSDENVVFNILGQDVDQEIVAAYLKPNPEDRNVSPWQMADYVNEQTLGYKAIARSGGDLELLKRFISAGYPVIIEKGYELPESGWWGHYLTVYGYDEQKEEFYSQDSYLGPFDGTGRTDSYADVQKYWQHFNDSFIVVYRTNQEAEVNGLLGEDMLDDFTMWRDIAAKNNEWVKENPDDMFAWFNLGTSLTRMGELTGEAEYYQAGAQAFDTARSFGLPPRMLWYQYRIYTAYQKIGRFRDVIDLANATLEAQGGQNVEETYWYKGHALLALGDIEGAKIAYREAMVVNENFYPAQWSLDYALSLAPDTITDTVGEGDPEGTPATEDSN